MTNEEFKEVLGFDKTNSRDYDGLRVAIKTYMTQNGISNRTQAGNEKWKTMIDWVMDHSYLHRTRQVFQDENLDLIPMRRAIHFLCLSCSKTLGAFRRAVEQNLVCGDDRSTDAAILPPPPFPAATQIAGQNTLEEDSQPSNEVLATVPATPELVPLANNHSAADASTPAEKIVPRWVRVSLLDLDLCTEEAAVDSPWSSGGITQSYYATMNRPTYTELLRVCSKNISGNRALQQIRGATCSPSIVHTWVNPDYKLDYHEVSLSDDEGVHGWLAHTIGVRPLRVLAAFRKTPPRTKVGV